MMSGAVSGARPARRGGLGGRDRRCAQGQERRAAGLQDRQGRRPRARRALPPRARAGALDPVARGTRAARAAQAAATPGAPADLGQERFGLLTQWPRIPLERLRRPDAMELLESRGVPEVWRRSVAEALAVIELLDERIAPLDRELGPLARADRRVLLLDTIPGIGPVLGSRSPPRSATWPGFPAAKLIGYAGLAPRVKQSGQRSRSASFEGWLAHAALRRRRSRPGRLANEPCTGSTRTSRRAPARRTRPRPPSRQGPDRLLARAQPRGALQAEPPHRSCPGKLPLLSGRLTARTRIEKPGQLPSEMVRHERRKRNERSSPTTKGVDTP